MRDYLSLIVALLWAALCIRSDLVAESVLLRQQLAILTHPHRSGPGFARAPSSPGFWCAPSDATGAGV